MQLSISVNKEQAEKIRWKKMFEENQKLFVQTQLKGWGVYRYCILAMLFVGTFTAYVLRVNINIAIIDMLDVPQAKCNSSSQRYQNFNLED